MVSTLKSMFFLALGLSVALIANASSLREARVAYAFDDIDWSLAYPLKGTKADYPNEGWRLVEADGQLYRVTDHLDELVQWHMENPDIRMAIASGGNEIRNLEFLKNVYPPSLKGKSLYEFVQIVQSYEDLKPGVEGAKRFSAAHRKAIESAPGVSKDYALFDDQVSFINQVKGYGMYAGKTYEYFPTWEDARKAIGNPAFDQRYVPKTEELWKSERNKLFRWKEVLDESAKEWRKTNKAFGKIVAEKAQGFRPRDLRCLTKALEPFIFLR